MPSPAARVDRTKSETVTQIRATVARLSPLSLRRLKENLFALELQLVNDMIIDGVDVLRVQALSHCCDAIAAVDQLQGGLRARSS